MSSMLSPHDIAQHYFSKAATPSRAGVSQYSISGKESNSSARGTDGDLTASGRYIAKETKKLLGQYHALSEQGNGFENASHLRASEEELLDVVRGIEEREDEHLSERERAAVVRSLLTSLEHYDILGPLLENPEVNDIIVRAYNDISVQTSRRNIQTDLSFPDHDSYQSFVENLLKRAGKACTLGSPIVDAAPDPHIRVCATHESLSPAGSGPMLTIRIARHDSISLDALVHYQLAPNGIIDFLGNVVAVGLHSLLIAGEVGTGKTTLVRALANRIPEEEAVLIIEDTHEISLTRSFVRTLITREANAEGTGRISPALAIRTGMRMAMNRLILGEMRDAEAAEAFIDVCASGHAGMSTIHSRSARDAVGRLELFLARAQGSVHMDTIRRQIANAVSLVVYLGVDRETHHRRILEVAEIGAYADGAIQFSPLFRYAPQHGQPLWRREAGVSQLLPANLLPSIGTSFGFDAEHIFRDHHRQGVMR